MTTQHQNAYTKAINEATNAWKAACDRIDFLAQKQSGVARTAMYEVAMQAAYLERDRAFDRLKYISEEAIALGY